jgi:hypothetical protein
MIKKPCGYQNSKVGVTPPIELNNTKDHVGILRSKPRGELGKWASKKRLTWSLESPSPKKEIFPNCTLYLCKPT